MLHVPVNDRDIALKAFASDEWRSATEALFQATGVNVNVMDFRERISLTSTSPCGYCPLAAEIGEPTPITCFNLHPDAEGSGRVLCRANLATLYAPVVREGRILAHAVVSGFVTSTRERRGLYEHMISRGAGEDAARRAIRTLPVVSRRQAESYLQIAIATARTVVDATAERLSAAERVEELRLFVSAGQQVVSAERLDSDTLGGIAEEAVALIGAEAGAVLRPRGSNLEVVAKTGDWRGPVGALVPLDSTASGRALEARRIVVSQTGDADKASIAMPLSIGQRVAGVLESRLPASRLPLSQEELSRLNRFGQFIAIALEREDERRAAERAMSGYSQLNELAVALGGETDMDGLSGLVSSVVEKAFSFQVSGLVLTGWGRDRADVSVAGQVSTRDLDHVLGVISGRDVETHPFETVRMTTHRGSVVEGPLAEDWALAVSEVVYGNLNVGWLFVARSDGGRYSAQDHALLQGLSSHAGAAFGRAALFSRIRDDYAKTIAALSATLDHGERTTSTNAGRLMEIAVMIGNELGLDLESVEQLRMAGLLHEVGKTGVPDEILLKPSVLGASEFEMMRAHAEMGTSIIDQLDFLKSLTPIILHHHEHWDGSGYPQGLQGDSIPLLARILSVADAYESMTTERSYRKKLTLAQARASLEADAGVRFDPRVIAALFMVLDRMALAGGTGLLADLEARGNRNLPA